MSAAALRRSVSGLVRRMLHTGLDRLSSPSASFLFCYAAGLVATWSLGQASFGAPALPLAAAAVAGLAIRYGRNIGVADALRLGAVGLAMAASFGVGLAEAGPSVALDLAAIWCASVLFARLRVAGFIASQTRLAAAAGAAAAAIGAIQSAPWLYAAAFGDAAAAGAASVFVTATLGAMLIVGVALSFDRADRRLGAIPDDEEPAPCESPAAWGALALFAIAAIVDGRQELALGASAVLLWFALRLGLFATALAAFLLVSTLLAFHAGESWRALSGIEGAEAELLRALALALLSLPSLVVAAVIHDHRAARRDLAFRAFHDGLTMLVNRARFLDMLTAATGAARAKGRRFALYLVDLDHFKSVNDSFGHPSGDALLVEVSRRLRDTVRTTDVVARLGGDEFAIIAPVPSADDAARLASRLVAGVDRPFVLNGLELRPSITVGAALAPDSSADPERLMALADHALYEAKAAGRNCWRISSADAADAFAVDWSDEREPKPQIVYLD